MATATTHYRDLAMTETACRQALKPTTRTTSRPASVTCPKCQASELTKAVAASHAAAKKVVVTTPYKDVPVTQAERLEAARQEAEDENEYYPEDH